MEEVYRTQGKIAMANWVADRLKVFAALHPDALAMTPAIFRDYLATMMEDMVREAGAAIFSGAVHGT